MSRFSRRNFIQTCLAGGLILPQFKSLCKAAPGSPKIPTRMVFLGMGFGVSTKGWYPSLRQAGAEYDLPKLLKPLARHKNDFSFIQNLSLLGEAPRTAAHAGSLYFLSDASAMQKVSINTALPSVDQVAAGIIGDETRFSSFVLAGRGIVGRFGGHGGGLRSLSWNREGGHMSATIGAFELYKKMYGDKKTGVKALQARLRQKKSVLDSLVRELNSLNSKLSVSDRVVLDQYSTSLREIEVQLQRSFEWATRETNLPHIEPPTEKISGIDEVKLTYDLITLAFQADLTRVASYMMPTETILQDLKVKTSPHGMSHYRGDISVAASHLRDETNAELLSYFFDKLKAAKQSDGQSLFDHSMIAYGSALKSRHTRANGPMIFAGYGGGGLKQGLNVVNPSGVTPISNLWLSMLRQVDKNQSKFTSSKNTVSEIFG